MAPWDELTYFQPLRITNQSFAQNTVRQLVSSDPQRVVLMIGTINGAGFAFLAPDIGSAPLINVGANAGVSNTQPLILTARDHPVLCQAGWWVQSTAVTNRYTVVECLLKEWPPERAADSDARLIAALAKLIAEIRRGEWPVPTTP